MRYKLLSKQKSEIHVYALLSKVVPEGWAVTAITAQPSGTTLLLSRIKAMQHNWIAKFSEIRLLGN